MRLLLSLPQVLSTLSILTNSALVGVTSYGLYFYFPNMSIVESMWSVLPSKARMYLCVLCISFRPHMDAVPSTSNVE